MKKTYLFTVIALIAVAFLSCKQEEYADWKIANQTWFERYKADTAFQRSVDKKFFNIKLDSTLKLQQTESGLCYRVIHQAYMRQPNINSLITVKYKGYLINGTVFDSGDNRQMYMYGSISGWQEGLQKMNTGGHYILYIPYNLAYDKNGSTDNTVPPYSVVIFDVELVACE